MGNSRQTVRAWAPHDKCDVESVEAKTKRAQASSSKSWGVMHTDLMTTMHGDVGHASSAHFQEIP
jgi:hypothetical protein